MHVMKCLIHHHEYYLLLSWLVSSNTPNDVKYVSDTIQYKEHQCVKGRFIINVGHNNIINFIFYQIRCGKKLFVYCIDHQIK